jgi:hypothetical protein
MSQEATDPIVPITQQLCLLGLWWLFTPNPTILDTQSNRYAANKHNGMPPQAIGQKLAG